MPRSSARDLYARKRREAREAGDRYVPLRLELVADASDRLLATPEQGGATILSVGGLWDRKKKRYVDPTAETMGLAERALVHRLHAGQIPAARWAAGWFEAHVGGEALAARVIKAANDSRAAELVPVGAALFYGGRRGGKTNLALWLAIAFAIVKPKARVWLIADSIPDTEELDLELQEMMPIEWGRDERLGAPHWRYTLPNGSTITLRSAHQPGKLKKGRCDFAVINEGQLVDERAFLNVLGCCADDGGLCIVAANPPEDPIGDWIDQLYHDTLGMRRPAVQFWFDSRLNHHVANDNLAAIAYHTDDDTYRREILGQFVGRRNRVFYAWADAENIRPTPQIGEITREVLRRNFGREFDVLVGIDFQLQPHMAAVVYKFYRDSDGDAEPLAWAVDEIVVEGNEDELIDAMIARGYTPERTVIVADATGEYQDAARVPGKTSWDFFHRRGFKHVYRPEEDLVKKNPLLSERTAAMNARIKEHDEYTADGKPGKPGKRRVFSDPMNVRLNRALKSWPNKNGVPNKRSGYAHLCDAASYPILRLFPRRRAQTKIDYRIVEKNTRREDFEVL
jgi:hypothetical protein